MDYKYLVCTLCFTYNHKSYIEDTLNGFAMQQTNFPFICCVVDDASTDGEPEVIQNYINKHFNTTDSSIAFEKGTDYAHIVYAQHKINQNCFIAVLYLKYNHYQIRKAKRPYLSEWIETSKYTALCEGDDYWTDPLKLQKQVDFLETHPDYTMCFHNAIEHWENGKKRDSQFSQIEDREYTGLEVYKDWIIPTASVVFHKSIYNSDLYKLVSKSKNFIFGDIVLFLTCAELGKIRGLQDTMSVYRRHDGGLTAIKSYDRVWRQGFHYLEIYKLFGHKYKKQSQFFFTKMYIHSFLKSIIDNNSKIRFSFLQKSLKESTHLTINALLKEIAFLVCHKKGTN